MRRILAGTDWEQTGPFLPVCIGFAFFLVGVLVTLAWSWSTPVSRAFVRSPEGLTWVHLFAGQLALCAVVGPMAWAKVTGLRRYAAGRRRALAAWLILLSLLLAFPRVLESIPALVPRKAPVPLAHHDERFVAITLVSYAVGLVGGAGFWLVAEAARAARAATDGIDERVAVYLKLRGDLQTLLFGLGVLVGEGTLSAGALRNAVNASVGGGPNDPQRYPPESVLLYGGYFTVLLAAVYLPTHRALRQVGLALCEALLPMPNVTAEAWGEWHRKRQTLEEFLQVRIGSGATFRAGVAIFAPLSGAAVSILIGSRT